MTTTEAILDRAASPFELTEVPALALKFGGSKVEFAAVPADQSKDPQSRAITTLARTSQPLYHWWWGWCVHDFEGMIAKDRIVYDWCHDEDEPIGYGDKFTVDKNGLTVSGRIESIELEPKDEAAKLIARSDKGIPYEASIYFQPMVLEYVEGGATATVNGETVSGPMTIFREWRLRAVAICPHGYDYGSETELAADKSPTSKFSWKGSPTMTKSTETPTTQTTPTTQLSESDIRNEFKAMRKRFTDRFGAVDGNQYVEDGLTFEAALEKHIDKLTADNAAEKKRADEMQEKLDAAKLSVGEPAIDLGAKGKGDTQKVTSFMDLVKSKN